PMCSPCVIPCSRMAVVRGRVEWAAFIELPSFRNPNSHLAPADNPALSLALAHSRIAVEHRRGFVEETVEAVPEHAGHPALPGEDHLGRFSRQQFAAAG